MISRTGRCLSWNTNGSVIKSIVHVALANHAQTTDSPILLYNEHGILHIHRGDFVNGYQTITDYYGNDVHLAIGACPFTNKPGHIWVICRFHDQWLLTKHSKRGFEFPGGKVETGETAEQAARREVDEETGAHIAALRVIGQYQVIGLNETFEKTIYYAEIDSITLKKDYLETNGPYFVSEFPVHLSADTRFSFLMKDAVLTKALAAVQTMTSPDISQR